MQDCNSFGCRSLKMAPSKNYASKGQVWPSNLWRESAASSSAVANRGRNSISRFNSFNCHVFNLARGSDANIGPRTSCDQEFNERPARKNPRIEFPHPLKVACPRWQPTPPREAQFFAFHFPCRHLGVIIDEHSQVHPAAAGAGGFGPRLHPLAFRTSLLPLAFRRKRPWGWPVLFLLYGAPRPTIAGLGDPIHPARKHSPFARGNRCIDRCVQTFPPPAPFARKSCAPAGQGVRMPSFKNFRNRDQSRTNCDGRPAAA